MELNFKNRTAIITGASSGIGLLTAQELAKRGANVVLCHFHGDGAEKAAKEMTAAGLSAVAAKVDSSIPEQIEAVVKMAEEKFGSVDILVNCAGGNAARILQYSGDWSKAPFDAVSWGIDFNLKQPIFYARAVLPGMLERKRGVIVNISSVDALTGATFGIEYGACKSAMFSFTKSLALIGAPNGVRSVCVVPGPVLTRAAMAKMKTPLGRAAEPIEIVDLILFLSSDKANFITGSVHTIDGGRSCGGQS